MLAKFRTVHPFLFAVLIYAIFFVGLNGTGALAGLVVERLVDVEVSDMTIQLTEIVCELVPALLFALVLSRVGRLGLLTKKGKGFLRGLAVGGYCLGFIAFVAFQTVAVALEEGYGVNLTAASFAYVVAMLLVGVTEEIEARALIGGTFLEHFGTSRSGAIKAAVASGLIFGAMHLTNALAGDVPGTMIQVALCVTGGILYAAVYFRCGNIWTVALIHGLNDVAAGTTEWLFNGGASIEVVSSAITPEVLVYPVVIGVLDLAVAFFLLRPAKAGEVARYWAEIEAPAADARADAAPAIAAQPDAVAAGENPAPGDKGGNEVASQDVSDSSR